MRRKKRVSIDETWLRHAYGEQRLSTGAIAGIVGCSHVTILRRLSELGIPTRGHSEAQKGKIRKAQVAREWLIQKYAVEKLSLSDIGELLSCSKRAVKARLQQYRIPLRKPGMQTGHVMDEQTRRKMSAAATGRRVSPRARANQSVAARKRWSSAEYAQRVLAGLWERPTSLEKQMIAIIDRNRLPFRYVGDGSFVVGHRNPDFVCTDGRRLLIEVANTYHHPPDYAGKRKAYFARFGWKTVVFLADKLDEGKVLSVLQHEEVA